MQITFVTICKSEISNIEIVACLGGWFLFVGNEAICNFWQQVKLVTKNRAKNIAFKKSKGSVRIVDDFKIDD